MGAAGPLVGLGPAARACVVAGLTSQAPEVDPVALTAEADLLVREGMAPIALEVSADLPGLDQRTFKRFHLVTLESQVRSMTASFAARRILATLGRRSLPVTVIKGPAVARLHPAGWPRSYTDIDLLVPDNRFGDVLGVCRDEGFTDPISTPPWPWFDAVCKEGVNLLSTDGGNIDVHHHVPPWVFGASLTADEVSKRAEPGEIGGVPVRLACPEHSTIIAALHVLNDLWKGSLGLVSWRDLIVLLHRLGPERAMAGFDAVRLGWLLTLVTTSLAESIPESEVPVLGSVRPLPLPVRARMAALGWSNDSLLSRHRVSFAARLPLAQASAFVAGCVVPQPQYVREYHGTYGQYWRHVWGETVSTVHGEDPRMNSTSMTKVAP